MIPEAIFVRYERFRREGSENALMFFVHNPEYRDWGPWIMTGENYKQAMECHEAALNLLDSVDDLAGVRIDVNGTQSSITGPCDGSRLKRLIGCKRFQMVPCTQGAFANDHEIWCDEEGFDSPVNEVATKLLGAQVYSGTLRGNVLLVKQGFIE